MSELRTAFTDLVGCTAPVQLAAMGGGMVTVELATAVSRAGGLGMINAADTVALETRLDRLDRVGAPVYGVNFTLHHDGERPSRPQVELAGARCALVEFFWARPNPEWVGWAKAAGALVGWQIGSVAEARQAVDAGCDILVVQGAEAGGHVRGTQGLLPLLAGTLDAVEVPVLAAGGISTPRSVAAVLAAGAAGVRVGTRFLATPESGAHPDYVAALLAADGQDTLLTEAFSVGWPNAPHRVLVSAVEAAQRFPGDVVGLLGEEPVRRLSAQTPNREATGEVAAMALYAGEGVGDIRHVVPVAQVVADLVAGARELLGACSG